ncbi:hypothetical protein ACLF6K_05870 [Streptomyces xanthophaeus]|uniref:hypothetical protein n=1 Tax=Streptomyces xanthophaeus TaxID=67385 RepID=UPI00398FDDD9
MSNPLSMNDITVKFHSIHAGVYHGEITLWQDPEGSPYRLVQRLDGIRSMNDEVERLYQLRTRLMDLQARREAESAA